jgi:hypothetical protein
MRARGLLVLAPSAVLAAIVTVSTWMGCSSSSSSEDPAGDVGGTDAGVDAATLLISWIF